MNKIGFTPAPYLLLLFFILGVKVGYGQSFNATGLSGESLQNPTSLQFGPDNRLYVSQQDGTILSYSVQRNNAAPGNGSYSVTETEVIDEIKTGVPNHNDNGSENSTQKRQITGLYVSGTSEFPIIYVSSSDWRIGGGGSGTNTNLDTNSGLLSRLSWDGEQWERVDLVRGLPRCEENHSTNGMDLFQSGNTTYMLLQQGGNTNMGAPSNNFTGTTETYLSGTILILNLTQLENMPVYNDNRTNTKFIYDLPTLNDPTRDNITKNDSEFPYPSGHPLRNSSIDIGDPFGGNDGLNQAIVEQGGPVQIFSPGYRNAYDVLISSKGKIYTSDNGPNRGWGGTPVIYTNSGNPKGNQGNYNPGAGDYVTNDFNEEDTATIGDGFHYVGSIGDANGTYYGGHPAPIRAFPSRAGIKAYTYNGSNWVLVEDHEFGDLLSGVSGYFQDDFSINDFPDDTRQGEYLSGKINSSKMNLLDVVASSTNGMCEYTASNFSGGMKGDILTASYKGKVNRYKLNSSGTNLVEKDNAFLEGFGHQPLDIIAQGDDDPFPGTIWAATYGANNITVFEPVDYGNCPDPGEPGYDPDADGDNDGYTNQDEIDNGTNHCSAGSKPADYDQDLVSDLNDPDDDNDGIDDLNDAFAQDSRNGSLTQLPIHYPFWNNDPGTGMFGLGFTGLMMDPNSNTDYIDQYDEDNLSFGGAGGKATIDDTDSGNAFGAGNSQNNAFQFGVDLDHSSQPFTVHSKIETPFAGSPAETGQSQGIYIGNGDQDNYLKIAIMDGLSVGDNINGIEIVLENKGSPFKEIIDIPGLTGANSVDLYISVDPSQNLAKLYYSIDGGEEIFGLGDPVQIPGSFLEAEDNQGLAIGIIATSGGGTPFAATWDFINITSQPSPGYFFSMNSGGQDIIYEGVSFQEDSNFVGGKNYTNPNADVPLLYRTERSSDSQLFSYSIPLPNDEYAVRLHFAEIFFGAEGGGSGGEGQRIFDVRIEDELVLDNYDIFAEVGAETVVSKTFYASVSDGEMNIGFSSAPEDGGINEPKISAIQIFDNSLHLPPILTETLDNQLNEVGELVDLSITATGGDPNENFTYEISGQPAGIDVEPTNGHIFGQIDPLAQNGGGNGDGLHSVTITIRKPGSYPLQYSFLWKIGQQWIDKDENENYTARHECSFVQAGDKFFLMGGRENARTLDIYDYTTDSWSELPNSVPFEFNHFQATEYQGLIWVIGSFKTNDFPNELPTENIWAYDPVKQLWFQGPVIPANRRRGGAGLVVYEDKFYVLGGNTQGHAGGYVPYFDVYDPLTGSWTVLNDAPRARDHFHAVVIGNKLYAAGGRLSGGAGGVFKPVIPEVDVYDFSNASWGTLPGNANLPTPRAAAATVNFNGKLVVIGGEVNEELVYGTVVNDALKITEEYDPASGSWTRSDDLNYERHGTQGIVTGGGIFVTAGSPNRGGGNQKNMEYLGIDAPEGKPLNSSVLHLPESVVLVNSTPGIIKLEIRGGNVGVFVRSMNINGTDADDFEIIDGELTNSLFKSNSEHLLTLLYTGNQQNASAILRINHGDNEDAEIQLKGNVVNGTGGVQTFTLVDADNDQDLFQIENGMRIYQDVIDGMILNIRADTDPPIVGSVQLELSGNIGAASNDNEQPYTLYEQSGGNYQGVEFNVGEYLIQGLAFGSSDGEGSIIGQELNISFSVIPENISPIAHAEATPLDGNAPLAVNFTGSGSSDEYPETLTYLWEFNDSSGTISEEPNPVHVFESEGTYTILLTVTDSGGLSDTDELIITVYPKPLNLPPIAVAEASPLTGYNPLSVSFVGSNSEDEVPDELEYLWQFNDGSGISSSLADPEHIFTQPGLFEVVLEVTDNEGLSDSATITVEVSALPNSPPVAVAEADIYIGVLPLSVSFNSEGSSDDKGIIKYYWDFDDGNSSDLDNPENTFTAQGEYNVTLTVEDEEGLSSTANILITVNSVPSAPLAVITASPMRGVVPLEVLFDGSNSVDESGTITYYWEFGDGNDSEIMNPTYVYTNAGTFNVSLTVENDSGLTDTAQITIIVDEAINGIFAYLLENPAREGIARVRILNMPEGVITNQVMLHDFGGRLISKLNAQELYNDENSYNIPIENLRDGFYFISLEFYNERTRTITLFVKN